MIATVARGRPRMSPAAGSHARIEQARQALVNAEEAYLQAHRWRRVLIGQEWMWQFDAGGVRLGMTRVEAVKFQHSNGEPKP